MAVSSWMMMIALQEGVVQRVARARTAAAAMSVNVDAVSSGFQADEAVVDGSAARDEEAARDVRHAIARRRIIAPLEI